jgi:hypothetical protein
VNKFRPVGGNGVAYRSHLVRFSPFRHYAIAGKKMAAPA